ncbi:MAG: hypothetical protein ACR2K5_13905 [Pseudolabrys sp.]
MAIAMYERLSENLVQPGTTANQFFAADAVAAAATRKGRRLRVLLLADDKLPIGAVRDHIEAIRRQSRHHIIVVNPVELRLGWSVKWADVDAIIIHYSISILHEYYLPAPVKQLIREFQGPKLQIIQDECRWVDRMTQAMADLGVGAVFSSLSLENLPRVYHHSYLRDVRFYSSLPGYVGKRYLRISSPSIAERSRHIVYRGQELSPWYGKAAREKQQIGHHALRLADRNGLTVDIKTREEDRIFGKDWIRHLTSGKAALSVEGGVSVFDFDDSVETAARQYQAAHPDASWDEIWTKTVQPYEGNVVHRTITPRIFESILCRTALVMYPGHFRGVLEPWKHYIPLERDGSNEAGVVQHLKDDRYLQELVDRAHAHVVGNPALRYSTYVKAIDEALRQLAVRDRQPVSRYLLNSVKRLPWAGVEAIVRLVEQENLKPPETNRIIRAKKTYAELQKHYAAEFQKHYAKLRARYGLIHYRVTYSWPSIIAYRFRRSLLPIVRMVRSRFPSFYALPPRIDGNRNRAAGALNILIICDFLANRVGTVRDHLGAFADFSSNKFCFVDVRTCRDFNIDLNVFDCVVFHYSIVISGNSYLPDSFAEKLRRYAGYKVLFIQDEYRFVDRTAAAMADLGVDVIYSVINEDVRDQIYRQDCIKHVRRKPTLTGFVPEQLAQVRVPDYEARTIDVGYRARRLFASLGALGQEKWQIGERFKRDVKRHLLKCDIEHEEGRRIYGKRWISFVMNCKAVLGTESCVSFIDFDGTVAPKMDAYEQQHPNESAAEIQAKFLGERDGELAIRVISPRCFEAAALRTLMILYPGQYSGYLEPWRHSVPLDRDHGNIDEVVAVLRDPARAKKIIDNAYNEVALNPAYSFRHMVEEFDRDLADHALKKLSRAARIAGSALPAKPSVFARVSNRLLARYQRWSVFLFLKHDFLWLRPRTTIFNFVIWTIRSLFPKKYQNPVLSAVKSVLSAVIHPKRTAYLALIKTYLVLEALARLIVPKKHRPALKARVKSIAVQFRLLKSQAKQEN